MTAKNSAHSRDILLVDDDEVGLSCLAESLTRAGFSVTTAASGEHALDCARTRTFGLALLDMRMPDMSGAELANRLINDFGCFSLILSGYGDPDSVRDAVRDGALGYLMKPMEATRLIPAIETALARSRELSGLLRSHDNLSTTLNEGRETSMAVGVLMERLCLDRDSAFVRLRDAARSQRRRVVAVAQEILVAVEVLNGAGTASGPQ